MEHRHGYAKTERREWSGKDGKPLVVNVIRDHLPTEEFWDVSVEDRP